MDRMLTLAREGFFCAQIMLKLALEAEGRDDPELTRAMGGLNGGVGNSGGVCGCLTGGACLISYFCGKGEADELPREDCDEIIAALRDWFKDYTAEYGGCECDRILRGDKANKVETCPMVIRDTFEKCLELLQERGVI